MTCAARLLVQEQRQRDRLVSGLAEFGVTVCTVDHEPIKPCEPVAMTMHLAGDRVLQGSSVTLTRRKANGEPVVMTQTQRTPLCVGAKIEGLESSREQEILIKYGAR